MRSLFGKSRSRGQMTIEMMLLIVGLLTVAMMVSKTAKSQGWMSAMISGPWKPIKSMIEDGVWTTDNSKAMHPHHRERHGSYEADEVTGGTAGGGDDGGFS